MSQSHAWNFYASESSVIFKLEETMTEPYWVEAHAHFGRYHTVPITVLVTSHRLGLSEGTDFLEEILMDLFFHRFPAFFGQRNAGVGVELQPTIYYFGIRLGFEAIAYDNPKRFDLPRQARQQVEQILNSIPAEELSSVAEGLPQPAKAARGRRKVA